MPSRRSIAAIHAAKTRAGLTDQEYRDILRQAGREHGLDIASSTQLPQNLVGAVISSITAITHRRRGWQAEQIRKVRIYAALAALDDTEMRRCIYMVSGRYNEECSTLTQFHFDRVMSILEAKAEQAVSRGDASWPAGYHPRYWRSRNPGRGEMNTREMHRVLELWDALCPHLAETQREEAYLCGIASHACGRRITDWRTVRKAEALHLIDALRDRLTHAARHAS